MERYTVKVVSPKEWERLVASNPRYQHAEDSVGFADPQTRTGYVMNTGVHRLNRYLLAHEFDHLVEEHATDEDEFGVRHKKFFKEILAPVLKVAGIAAAPFTGGLSLLAAPGIDTGIALQEGQKGVGKTFLKSYGTNVLGAGGGAALGGAAAGGLGATLGGAAGGALGGQLTGQGALQGGLRGAAGGGLQGLLGNILGAGGQASGQVAGQAGQAAAKTGASITGQAPAQAAQASRFGIGPGTSFSVATPQAGSSLVSPASRIAGGIGGQAAVNPLSKFGLPQTLSFGQPAPLSPAPAGMGQAFSQAASQAGPSLTQFGKTVLPGIPSAPPPQPPTGNLIKQFLDKAKAGLSNFAGQAAGGAAGSAAMNLFSPGQGGQTDWGDLAVAGGLVGAGQAVPTPQLPSLSGLPSVQRVQQAADRGYATDIGRVANTRLNEQLTAPYSGVSENVTSAIRRPFQEERTQEARNLKAYQPGFNLDDPEYQRAIAPSLGRESDALAMAEQRERSQFDQQRRQDIQLALGVDEQTFQQLSNLADLDAQQIAIQAGIDFETARQFKEAMGSLAGMFATRGLGLNRFQLVSA